MGPDPENSGNKRKIGRQSSGSLGDALGYRLGRAHRVIRDAWEMRICDLKLSPPQAAMLRAICESPGSGLRELARWLRTDAMNAKRLVDHLEQNGLVHSSTDPTHRQRRLLDATEEGEKLEQELTRRGEAWNRDLSNLLGEADFNRLEYLLDMVEQAVARESASVSRIGYERSQGEEQGMEEQDQHQHGHDHGHGQQHWNERYASAPRLFNAEPDETLVELAGHLSPGRAIDLGAGEGRNTLWLARKKWQVTAVDLSDIALGRLAAEASEEGLDVNTVAGDIVEYLGHGDLYDLVVLAFIQWIPEERARLLDAASAAVAPGGHLFLIGHHIASLGKGGPPQPERLYTEESLRDAFPGLKVLKLERQERAAGDIGIPMVDIVAWAERSTTN